MIRAVVVVVVTVVVVAVPVVADAVHEDHPFLHHPFPRPARARAPQRNGRLRAVVRMAGNVVAVGMVPRRRMVLGRRMVARLRAGVFMLCGGMLIDMPGGSGRLCRARLGGGPRGLWRVGHPCRAAVAAVVAVAVAAFRRGECHCAECRAGDSDECEFYEVLVHSAPSLSVLWI